MVLRHTRYCPESASVASAIALFRSQLLQRYRYFRRHLDSATVAPQDNSTATKAAAPARCWSNVMTKSEQALMTAGENSICIQGPWKRKLVQQACHHDLAVVARIFLKKIRCVQGSPDGRN
jgi:hypothetical protein